MRRAGLMGGFVLAVTATASALAVTVAGPVESAQAADLSKFDPGYIISDQQFYDPYAMTASEVQAFLNAKVPDCREDWSSGPDDPIVCLKDYKTKTTARSANAYCKGYAAKTQTAAQIIDGVARSCGVSQKALLVILQKETGLVTHKWPSAWRYERAMGYACPDTAPCDELYYGFFNQVYSAAQQFKVYQSKPTRYSYVAGQTNQILYHPKSSCGRKSVTIKNQATAGLYIYTPYTPNAAALTAGYGTGDACSSYGNRNFFAYYSDWFGSPTSAIPSVPAELKAKYSALGGAAKIGRPAAVASSMDGGVYQTFSSVTLYASPSGVVTALSSASAITQAYVSAGGPSGVWGWPTQDESSRNGVARVTFGKLMAYSVGSAVRLSQVPVASSLEALWFASESWGQPVGKAYAVSAGAYQRFSAGYVFISPEGRVVMMEPGWSVTTQYLDAGGPAGTWGWPQSARVRIGGRWSQAFDKAVAVEFSGRVAVRAM